MNKNKKILIILISLLVLLTGCTKQLKDADGKVVKDEKTNQVLIENILCKPEELKDSYSKVLSEKAEAYLEKYESGDLSKNEYEKKIKSLLNIDELPACTKMSIVEGGYENLWTSVFVKPLAWIIVNIGKLLWSNYGLAIIVVTFLIKLVLLPFTLKSLKQTAKIQEIQPKMKKIEKKYANKTDQESLMMKSNETMALYKEYNINPMSGCLMSFIQIPLFFAFYEAIYRLPILFEGKFLGLHLGTTPLAAAGQGSWYYLILPVLVGIVTYFSFKMNKSTMSDDQMKQMKMMMNIMIIMIFITSFSMSTAIIIYWVTNSLFTIIQNLIVKRSK